MKKSASKSQAKDTALSVRSLTVTYGGVPALKNVAFDIPANKITALIGASGSGKSTFLRCLNRMIDTVSGAEAAGEIMRDGNNILDKETDVTTLRKEIGMVFQTPTPFPKSIYDNIAYGLEVQGFRNKRSGRFLLGRRKIDPAVVAASHDPVDKEVVRSLKEAALWSEVKDRLHTSALGLSGGQQQRLSIARALAIRPKVLLLDEPCSALDPISTEKIEDMLLELKDQYTIVIVTHNLRQARRIADNVSFFHLGHFIEYGTSAAMFHDPKKKLTRDYVQGHFG